MTAAPRRVREASLNLQAMKEQLTGIWMLVSWEQTRGDGFKIQRYGANPKGIAFFDAGGRYIITVMRSDRANYAGNALWQGTAEENKETADGTITYFGTYEGPEADGSIAIHIESSSFPNLEWYYGAALCCDSGRPIDTDRSSPVRGRR